MIFADHATRFLPAIDAVFGGRCGWSAGRRRQPHPPAAQWLDSLLATPPSAAADAAHAAVGPDTVAKFLFTSGTTGSPKAVIQTQRMLCSNQVMVAAAYDFLRDDPPVLVDWAPWNHTASGNKVFNMAIFHGGTYHIDDGRPTPADIGKTIRNLRDVAPTWYFNVPIGYQFLLDAMEADEALADHFFSRLKMLMYAGAGMSQPVWDRLTALAARKVPGGVPIVSGLGATETGPFALYYSDKKDRPGNIGFPALGVTLKLVPQDDKLEARVKSPSVTPGYWRNPADGEALTTKGSTGWAMRCAMPVPGDPAAGFIFDGRSGREFQAGHRHLGRGRRVARGPGECDGRADFGCGDRGRRARRSARPAGAQLGPAARSGRCARSGPGATAGPPVRACRVDGQAVGPCPRRHRQRLARGGRPGAGRAAEL
jgi:feruloyl-CoA synthase